jgi:glycosyltransferase involved in cell wall biosynthesis
MSRCLAALGPAERIVVVDSQSTDGTVEIAESSGCEVIQFKYAGGYPKKRQWALDNIKIDTPWILFLDADEVIPAMLWAEIVAVTKSISAADGYLITKGFHFLGRCFRFGGFSHSAVLLVKSGRARFERLFDDAPDSLDMEIHERVIVDGRIDRLSTPLIHEDFKGLEAYISRHNKYSTWEATVRIKYLSTSNYGADVIAPSLFGNSQERRRYLKQIIIRLPFEHIIWFCYHYFFRLAILEGMPGLIASRIRSHYIAQTKAKMYELKRHGLKI